MTIKSVMFDAVGTLIYASPPVAQVYYSEGLRQGSQLTASQVQDRLQQFMSVRLDQDAAGQRSYETCQEEWVRRWRQVVRDVFEDLADTSAIFEALWFHFARASSWALYPDVGPALQALRGNGIEVGVASNFDDRLDPICQELCLAGDSSRVFHSARLGVQKPGLAFFRRIEAELELRPDELAMVGDDWQDDFQAARQAGWHSFWLRREGQAAEANELTSLRQLVDVIA